MRLKVLTQKQDSILDGPLDISGQSVHALLCTLSSNLTAHHLTP